MVVLASRIIAALARQSGPREERAEHGRKRYGKWGGGSRGFFGRALAGGFFGCLGVGVALVVVIIVVIAVIALAAGGGDDEADVVGQTPQQTEAPDGQPTSSEEPEETAEPDVLNLNAGDTAKVGDAEVTVHGARRSTGEEFFSPDAGNVWIIVDVTVRNSGDDAYNLSSLLQTGVRDPEGREYDIAIGPDTQGSLDGTIPAEDLLRGEAAFEVPEAATGLQFVFKQAIGEEQARWNVP